MENTTAGGCHTDLASVCEDLQCLSFIQAGSMLCECLQVAGASTRRDDGQAAWLSLIKRPVRLLGQLPPPTRAISPSGGALF